MVAATMCCTRFLARPPEPWNWLIVTLTRHARNVTGAPECGTAER